MALSAGSAIADDAPPAAPTAPEAPATPPAPEPAPAAAPLGIRASLAGAAQLQSEADQRTIFLIAGATYTLPRGPRPSFFARLGWVQDNAADASGVSNLLIGGSLPIALPRSFKLEPHLSIVLPTGSGGGNDADPDVMGALLSGSGWGGPMFVPNHLTVGPGVRLSYSRSPLFALVDTALNRSMRVRGEDVDPIGPTITFSPTTLVVGVAASPAFAFYGGVVEIRYWGSPAFVEADPPARDDHYAFLGVDWAHSLGGKQVQVQGRYFVAVDPPRSRRDLQVFEISSAFAF